MKRKSLNRHFQEEESGPTRTMDMKISTLMMKMRSQIHLLINQPLTLISDMVDMAVHHMSLTKRLKSPNRMRLTLTMMTTRSMMMRLTN